jgi:hypothetical protein
MKRIIVSLLLALVLVSAAFGQVKKESTLKKQCSLTLAQAPQLRGFSLGMTQERVVARFPGISIDRADQSGVAKLRLTVIESLGARIAARDRAVQADIVDVTGEGRSFTIDASRFPDLKGVRKIQLQFINGRISYVGVAYDDSIKWETLDEFVRTVSKILNLPEEWQRPADSDSDREKELRCSDFVLTADVGGDPTDTRVAAHLILEDLAAIQALERRQKDLEEKAKRAEEEKRKTFKP